MLPYSCFPLPLCTIIAMQSMQRGDGQHLGLRQRQWVRKRRERGRRERIQQWNPWPWDLVGCEGKSQENWFVSERYSLFHVKNAMCRKFQPPLGTRPLVHDAAATGEVSMGKAAPVRRGQQGHPPGLLGWLGSSSRAHTEPASLCSKALGTHFGVACTCAQLPLDTGRHGTEPSLPHGEAGASWCALNWWGAGKGTLAVWCPVTRHHLLGRSLVQDPTSLSSAFSALTSKSWVQTVTLVPGHCVPRVGGIVKVCGARCPSLPIQGGQCWAGYSSLHCQSPYV